MFTYFKIQYTIYKKTTKLDKDNHHAALEDAISPVRTHNPQAFYC